MSNRAPTLEPASMLIILMGAIGDVVRGLALPSQIKRAYPRCRLTWLVEPTCAALVQANPDVDRVVVFDRKHPLSGLLRLGAELRQESYDVVLDLQRHFKSGFFSFLSRGKRRIGFHRGDAKEFNWLFNAERIVRRGEDRSKLEHYFAFLDHLGIARQASPDFGFRGARTASLPAELDGFRKNYHVLILGSSWESKNWFVEGYEKLAAMLLSQEGAHLVLCGDRHQSAAAEALMSAPALAQQSDRVHNFVARSTLLELVEILRYARCAIGPDSGPAHISAAVGTPHITLFGPTSPARVSPWNCEGYSLQSQIGCRNCYRRSCPGLGKLCMRLISPESVIQKVQLALAGPAGLGGK